MNSQDEFGLFDQESLVDPSNIMNSQDDFGFFDPESLVDSAYDFFPQVDSGLSNTYFDPFQPFDQNSLTAQVEGDQSSFMAQVEGDENSDSVSTVPVSYSQDSPAAAHPQHGGKSVALMEKLKAQHKKRLAEKGLVDERETESTVPFTERQLIGFVMISEMPEEVQDLFTEKIIPHFFETSRSLPAAAKMCKPQSHCADTGSAQHTSTQVTSADGASKQRTGSKTSKPAQRRASSSAGESGRTGSWSLEECKCAVASMKAIVLNQGIRSEQRFEKCAELMKEQGYNRGKTAIKNQFSRRLRDEFEWDDRMPRRDGKQRELVTSARENKKRSRDEDEDEDEDEGKNDEATEANEPAAKRARPSQPMLEQPATTQAAPAPEEGAHDASAYAGSEHESPARESSTTAGKAPARKTTARKGPVQQPYARKGPMASQPPACATADEDDACNLSGEDVAPVSEDSDTDSDSDDREAWESDSEISEEE